MSGREGGRRGHRAPLVPIDRIGAHARAHTHRAGVSWVWITFARTHRRTCMHARAHTHTHTHRAGWGWGTCRAWACCPRTSGEEITPLLSLCMSHANHTISLPFVCHVQITPLLFPLYVTCKSHHFFVRHVPRPHPSHPLVGPLSPHIRPRHVSVFTSTSPHLCTPAHFRVSCPCLHAAVRRLPRRIRRLRVCSCAPFSLYVPSL